MAPLPGTTARREALRTSARRRRLDLAGYPDLPIEQLVALPTASLAAARFPSRDAPYTFATTIQVTSNGGTHAGIILELGDDTTALALWLDDDAIVLRAGDTGDDAAEATFTTGTGELPVGRIFRLVAAVNPGSGQVRLWDQGGELARATAANGALPNGWAAASAGAYAAAAQGALPADVLEVGAPDGFAVLEPLRVYAGVPGRLS